MRLTKGADVRSETDRVAKYAMAELRRWVGSGAPQAELRSVLTTFFQPPARG